MGLLNKLLAPLTLILFPTFASAADDLGNKLQENKLGIAIAILIYFLPSWIAWQRKHHNKGPIIITNLILGWTILGWIAALIWSVSAIRTRTE
jgi:hypothetical protein